MNTNAIDLSKINEFETNCGDPCYWVHGHVDKELFLKAVQAHCVAECYCHKEDETGGEVRYQWWVFETPIDGISEEKAKFHKEQIEGSVPITALFV